MPKNRTYLLALFFLMACGGGGGGFGHGGTGHEFPRQVSVKKYEKV